MPELKQKKKFFEIFFHFFGRVKRELENFVVRLANLEIAECLAVVFIPCSSGGSDIGVIIR